MDTCVLQDWLRKVGWKQQSILFSGLRGPDKDGCPALKVVNRWMRTVTQHNADPSKPYMRAGELPDPYVVCEELEFLPCHYVHHLADALAVIAYGHPDAVVVQYAAEMHFRIAEELFHFVPEQPFVFRLRHRDKPDGADPQDEQWRRRAETMERDYMDAVQSEWEFRREAPPETSEEDS